MENSYQYHLVYNLIFTQSSINFKFLYESIKLLLLGFMLMSIFLGIIINPTLSGIWNGARYPGGGHYDPPPWNQPEWSYRGMWGVKLGVLGYAQFI